MKKKPASPDSSQVVALLMQKEDDAAAALFIELYRRSPFLRDWLGSIFARSSRIQDWDRFKQLLDTPTSPEEEPHRLLLSLTGSEEILSETQRKIRRKLRIKTGRIYGGLSWREVETLVRRYHAGTIDAGAFLLTHDWRKGATDGGASARLTRAGAALLDEAIQGRQKLLLRHVAKAVEFLDQSADTRTRRTALGHVNWWKVSILLYLLNHPKPAYRTRELRAHLAALGLEIETKDIRRFCSRHAIKRDMRAGRPTSNYRESIPRKTTKTAASNIPKLS